MIDEASRNLKIHRKSATRLLNNKSAPRSRQGKVGGGRKPYSEAAKKVLVMLWRDMGYIGSLRMKVAIPEWLDSYSHTEISGVIR